MLPSMMMLAWCLDDAVMLPECVAEDSSLSVLQLNEDSEQEEHQAMHRLQQLAKVQAFL